MSVNTIEPAKILLTTDFSENAACAFPYAAGLARRHGSELVILHVTTGHSNYVEDNPIYHAYGRLSQDNARTQIQQVIIPGESEINVRRVIITSWSAKDGIVDFAKSEKPDLIVISTRGHGLVPRLVLGSVARSVIAEAPCPVLCVKCSETGMFDDKQQAIRIARIAVPIDLSEESRVALKLAAEYAKAYEAQLHLIYVVHFDVPEDFLPEDAREFLELDERLHASFYERLQEFCSEVDFSGEKVVTSVKKGSPAKQVAHYAESHSMDLIILSRKGLGRTPHTLGGMVGRLLHDANCPTLII